LVIQTPKEMVQSRLMTPIKLDRIGAVTDRTTRIGKQMNP
jgi:hypothetical protein